MEDGLAAGLYEQLMTAELRGRLADLRSVTGKVDPEDEAEVLGEFVGRTVARRLAGVSSEQRVHLVNAMLVAIGPDVVEDGPRRLLAVLRPEAPGVLSVDTRPTMALSRPALLTNGPDDPSLGNELRAELASADRVDLLCAFVKWYGLRVLEPELLALRERGVRFRVITTTYMGATDRTALDRLVRDFGAEVRVNYETRSTRLHAKAWLLHRESGYGTAYVGSSNLSRAALLDGLEWNVKLADAHTPELIKKFSATFDSYWLDESFVPYDPERDAARLDEALAAAGGNVGSAPLRISGLEVRPYPHQQRILDDLVRERSLGHHRNLVVAATGTGKTVVAALDYAAMAGRPRLLFVAHRRELLAQALRTYREVLGDGSFGELWVDGQRPERWQHVFASIQSLSRQVAQLRADQFEVVVIDEFHHAQAATYQRLLAALSPLELLGLTATPERTDGIDVRAMFDGRTASELRLWDALRADLLCPFHYFGVADGTDLSRLQWRRGDYDVAELENVFTADDARVRIVLAQLRDKVDTALMRGLGFCVSVRHAEFMAERFELAGIPARAVSANTSREDRDDAVRQLRSREVNVLFAVDLFNEGLDIPEIDTLLLLRPTQSATVFLQQLGRGMRRTADKPVLTVLDFIGLQRMEFRFDLRLRALTGATRSSLQRQLEDGFARLPAGSELVLDRVSRQIVLDNVRRQLSLRRSAMVEEVRSHGDLGLGDFLRESGRELSDIYVRQGSWTALRRAAGFGEQGASPDAPALRRVAAFLHVDDHERATAYASLLGSSTPYEELDPRQQRFARMVFFSVWIDRSRPATYGEGLSWLRRQDDFVEEVTQVLRLGPDRAEVVPTPLASVTGDLTLAVHARYSREEILAAIDYVDLDRSPRAVQTGVVWSPRTRTDAFLVTLHKNERTHSPSTMYRDFALSPNTFHWESQNATTADGETGRRYREHKSRGNQVLLFARESASADWDPPTAYLFLGAVSYVGHAGERPMAITWRLDAVIPPTFYGVAAVVA